MRLAVLFTAAGVACGPSTATAPAPPAPRPAAPVAVPPPPLAIVTDDPSTVRLETAVTVRAYRPRLVIDPAQPTFDGTIEIDATVAGSGRELWLHGDGLTIQRAKALTAAGEVPLEATAPDEDRLVLRAPADVTPEAEIDKLPASRAGLRPGPLAGEITLVIDYKGVLAATDTLGVFRQQEAGAWYAFTQFEPLAARRAFPCIDEPTAKVPWTLTLVVPRGLVAVSNTPIAKQTDDGALRRIEFEPTPPLPSYLVAFGIGPFDIVDAGRTSSGKPIRIIALAGRAKDATFAAEVTPKIVAWLEQWFGMEFPYSKIDSMAIPMTVGFGAMENPGLITYRAERLLISDDAAEGRRRAYAMTATHELAHQWFGDLVTPVWWDDIWLNESFASWLPGKVAPELFPQWTTPADLAISRGGALDADRLATARRVRQPITTENDIHSAFDGISYAKGAAVLRMFERWAGVDKFQEGVRAYLRAHAHGNATAADFLAAVSTATGADVTGAMSTFLDQPGAPRITATLTCTGDRATIALQQSRYLPVGAATTPDKPVWKVPVCVVYGGTGKKAKRHEVCGLLTEPTGTLTGEGCTPDAWVYANAGARGYYRVAVGATNAAIRKHGWRHLDPSERVAFAQDLIAAVDAGEADIADAFALVPALVAEQRKGPVTLATGIVSSVRRFLPDRDPVVARWVRATFGKLATRFGWLPKKGELLEVTSMREEVVPLVAEVGRDQALRRQAVALAKDWRKLPEAMRGKVMAAAVRAKPELADRWRADFVAEPDRVVRGHLAHAIAVVPDRARVEQALALVLDAAVDVRLAGPIIGAASGNVTTRAWATDWVVAHLDELIARYPRESAATLVGPLITSCDAAKVEPMRALADAKLRPLVGGPRAVIQAFERLDQCIARRRLVERSLGAWRQTLRSNR